MSYPPEYTEAKNKLDTLRNKLLNDIIYERLKRRLTVRKDVALKYKDVVDEVNVTASTLQLFNRRFIVLRNKFYKVADKVSAKLKLSYIGERFKYPIHEKEGVPEKELPSVPVFEYKPPSDIEMLEKIASGSVESQITLRVKKDQLVNEPEMENSVYDFYTLKAKDRCREKVENLSAETPGDYEHIEYESVLFGKLVKLAETGNLYYIRVILYPHLRTYSSKGDEQTYQMLLTFYATDLNDNIVTPPIDAVLFMGGHSFDLTDGYTFYELSPSSWYSLKRFHRWTPTDTTVMYILSEDWRNTFKFEVYCDPPNAGKVNVLPPLEYCPKADIIRVEAVPYSGWKFSYWRWNGIHLTNQNPFEFWHYEDTTLVAVFEPA